MASRDDYSSASSFTLRVTGHWPLASGQWPLATPPSGGAYLTALTALTRLTGLTADRIDIVDVVDSGV